MRYRNILKPQIERMANDYRALPEDRDIIDRRVNTLIWIVTKNEKKDIQLRLEEMWTNYYNECKVLEKEEWEFI